MSATPATDALLQKMGERDTVSPEWIKLREHARALELELIERRFVGRMLANAAYNLSQQRSRLIDRDCEILKDLQTKWDKITAV